MEKVLFMFDSKISGEIPHHSLYLSLSAERMPGARHQILQLPEQNFERDE
jgi:hypothetical protein